MTRVPHAALEKTLEHIKDRGDRSTNRSEIARLLLEALVEYMKMRRKNMEDGERSGNSQGSREQNQSRAGRLERRRETEEDGIITPAGWQPDPNPDFLIHGVHGYIPVDAPPPRHTEPDPHPRIPNQERIVEPHELSRAQQGGGEPSSGDHRRRRHRERHHSHSLGPPPNFKLKPNLTLGMYEHYKNCVAYYVADREKESQRVPHHKQREARKKAEADHSHHHSRHHDREHRGRRRDRSLECGSARIPQAAGGHHLAEAKANNARASRNKNPHYQSTPYSAAVEDIERQQADVLHSVRSGGLISHIREEDGIGDDRVYDHSGAPEGAADEYYHHRAPSVSPGSDPSEHS